MFPIKDTVQSRSVPLVNWTLIGLNVAMFMVELAANAHGQAEAMVEQFGVVPARFLAHPDVQQMSTLVTSMFLHGGWFHLFANMWALYIFGDGVEDRMGPARYLIFYLLCGIAAGLAHVLVNRSSTMPSLGASGAIAGVLAAYLALYPKARVITLIPIVFIPFFIEIPAVVFVGLWFLSQLLNGTLQIVHTASSPEAGEAGGVAWWAHVGGFIAGGLLVYLFAPPASAQQSRARRPRYADQYYPW